MTVFKFLTSYHYFKNYDYNRIIEGAQGRPLMIFGDSGAYSAASLGATIDLDDYAQWIIKWQHILTTYSNLDVIGDADGSMINQRRLETEYGLNPLPVFHVGSEFTRLEALCEEYDYIALGGMVPYSTTNLGSWLLKCFKVADKHGTVFHGFGQTRREYLMDFPWYSVDSSSWGKGHIFGHVDIWDDNLKNFQVFNIGNREEVYKHAELIRTYACDPEWYADREKYHRKHAIALTSESWRRFERFLQERHRRTWETKKTPHPGPNLFMADTDGSNLIHCYQAIVTDDVNPIISAENLPPIVFDAMTPPDVDPFMTAENLPHLYLAATTPDSFRYIQQDIIGEPT